MALVSMVVHCTKENNRQQYAERSISSLLSKNLGEHRVFFVLNGCDDPHFFFELISKHSHGTENIKVLFSRTNLGTAKATNLAWKLRNKGEHCIKIDDDIIINGPEPFTMMEQVANRLLDFDIAYEKGAGVIGAKRKDAGESTYRDDWGATKLVEVPHEPGESWHVIEVANHIMGNLTLHTSKLLDKVGYLYQGKLLYGYDDTLICSRARAEGFYSCFVHGIDIDHIDPGDTDAAKKKRDSAGGEAGEWCIKQMHLYETKAISTYHGPNDD